MYKNDFPIFKNNEQLIYLDSTATSQKPAYVIDGISEYLSSSYANIHRGSYEISEISERLYEDSKKIVARHIGAKSWREVIYTGNSTYALNLLSQSLWRTGILQKGDKVLVSVVEHHANVVPWLILAQDYEVEVEFIGVDENFDLDFNDLESRLTENVKVVSLAHVSNTTGQIFDIARVKECLARKFGNQNQPLLIVDASQSVPHFSVDAGKLGVDALFFTGHKVFADSGIGVLWAKEELLNKLQPIFSGGGAIGEVKQHHFTHSAKLPDKFEPGTPNLTGAVSLLRAFEYIEQIGGYAVLESHERELVEYALEKFAALSVIPADAGISSQTGSNQSEAKRDSATSAEGQDCMSRQREELLSSSLRVGESGEQGGVKLIGSVQPRNRVGVFTFVVSGIHSFDISDYLAEHNICIRAGQHCAEPFMEYVGQSHTCRMSLGLYNTREDIDRFFEVLEMALRDLKS